ncbi:MAG: PAS domain S-box protein [Edaphobacter sp.]|uniref:ATP-binding protein n=1 Tax=Edaphobacter sp. TaxID=1934404 RepID=UPI00238BC792|nr:ATP-binding protein [Edaphobacter sp.]MDE1175725.1 PAS domain S-box protein [Edaphobacter sp.]
MLRSEKKTVLLLTGLLIAVIAFCDWHFVNDLPLGFLYLLPMLLIGRVLPPLQIAGVAAICTFLTEIFDVFAWNATTGLPRDVLYFAAFFLVGLFIHEVNRNRLIVIEHLHEIEQQRDARHEAEEQLRVLIESSPAAIIMADADGRVLMANDAAHRMLALGSTPLAGRSIQRYFPALSRLPRYGANQQLFRTVMQSRGEREDGEVFLADICFSTYRTDTGTRLAAMILDASEELRTREETGLRQMMSGLRIAVAAVSHEIRNVCGAIAVVHQNLSRSGGMAQNKDFEALGNLVLALERIAAVDLQQSPDHATEVDLISLLDDLRIVISPSLHDDAIECNWIVEPDLPLVWADRASLMQVFLNLTSNSHRALSLGEGKALSISVRTEHGCVLVEFADNGGGVKHPEKLFHPFQNGAQNTGLGLYLSRALMRSFGGELRYRTISGGASFIVQLSSTGRIEKYS